MTSVTPSPLILVLLAPLLLPPTGSQNHSLPYISTSPPWHKLPFSLARTHMLPGLFSLLPSSTFSPQDSKDHLYSIQMQLWYHPLRKTTGLMTKILNKVQVSFEIWPRLSLWAHFQHISVHSVLEQHWSFNLFTNAPHSVPSQGP